MDENIFEAARKMGTKKKVAASKPAPEAASKKNENLEIDPEVKGMLQKIQDMSNDLDNQLDSIYKKGKEAKINVSVLIENTGQLSDKQFEDMQAQKKTLMDKITKAVPPASCLKKKQKSKEELTQERKGKMRGARNNWIPVR